MNLDPTAIQPTDQITLFDQRFLPGISLPGVGSSYLSEYVIPSPVVGRPDLQYPNGPFVNLREAPVQQQLVIPTGVTVTFISGPGSTSYSETLSPIPGVGQFYVNYANGTVSFNAADATTTVLISYTGRGSIVRAEHINNIIYPLVPFYNNLIGVTSDGSNFSFGTVTITGNLTLNGVINETPSGILEVDNPILLLDRVHTGSPINIGIEIARSGNPEGSATNPQLVWNETNKQWNFNSTSAGPTSTWEYPLLTVYDKGGMKPTVLTTTQETALTATLSSPADDGLMWFNSTTGNWSGWYNSAIHILG